MNCWRSVSSPASNRRITAAIWAKKNSSGATGNAPPAVSSTSKSAPTTGSVISPPRANGLMAIPAHSSPRTVGTLNTFSAISPPTLAANSMIASRMASSATSSSGLWCTEISQFTKSRTLPVCDPFAWTGPWPQPFRCYLVCVLSQGNKNLIRLPAAAGRIAGQQGYYLAASTVPRTCSPILMVQTATAEWGGRFGTSPASSGQVRPNAGGIGSNQSETGSPATRRSLRRTPTPRSLPLRPIRICPPRVRWSAER